MSANAWSTKCWWNQKLIAQFFFFLLCEMNILSLVSQNLNNFYQIQTKCYRNSDTVFFSPIHRTKRGLYRQSAYSLRGTCITDRKWGALHCSAQPQYRSYSRDAWDHRSLAGWWMWIRSWVPHIISLHYKASFSWWKIRIFLIIVFSFVFDN
jgi:hypothetical protein